MYIFKIIMSVSMKFDFNAYGVKKINKNTQVMSFQKY